MVISGSDPFLPQQDLSFVVTLPFAWKVAVIVLSLIHALIFAFYVCDTRRVM